MKKKKVKINKYKVTYTRKLRYDIEVHANDKINAINSALEKGPYLEAKQLYNIQCIQCDIIDGSVDSEHNDDSDSGGSESYDLMNSEASELFDYINSNDSLPRYLYAVELVQNVIFQVDVVADTKISAITQAMETKSKPVCYCNPIYIACFNLTNPIKDDDGFQDD